MPRLSAASRSHRPSATPLALGVSFFLAMGPVAVAQPLHASASVVPAPAGTTFNRDIAPILFKHCGACHRPGGSAPFSLIDYNTVRPRAAQIAAVTRTRQMPPWKAEPGYGEFIGQRPLSSPEIATLERWVNEGARKGAPQDLPSLPAWSDGWQLGTPDLVLTPADTYTLPAEGTDRFRVFVLPIPVKDIRYVRGVEFRPDDSTVVHHANILIDRTPSSRERNEQDPTLGESGLLAAAAEYPPGQLLGWTPGQPDPLAPKGMAWPLAPGTDLVVQLHMVPNGTPHPIGFSVGIFLTSDPPERAPVILRLGRRDIDIAAGQRDHVVTDSYVLPVDVVVHAVKPHAHYRAREISGAAVLPDGSTKPLLLIKDWDFRWQHVYRYVVPVALPKGTRVTLRCTYDNSVSPRRNPDLRPSRIRWGPRSSDEMGDLWLQVVARSERDAAALAADFGQKWLRDEIAGYQTLIEREPGNFSLHDEVAWLHVQGGRAEEAAKHYETFVRLKPESPTGRFNLATALMLSGRIEDAAANYLEALRLKPDYAAAHNNLGNLYGRLGRDADALEHFQASIQADPTHAGARNNLGFLLMRRGDAAGARLHFAEAIRLDPRLPDAHYNLGLLTESEGDAPAARGQFEEALRLKPDWVPPLTALGWMLAASADDRVRNASKAIQIAQRSVDLTNRRDAVALDALAAAYAEAGQFDRALDTLREALGLASGTSAEAAMFERREGYAAGRPYRQGPEKRPVRSDADDPRHKP